MKVKTFHALTMQDAIRAIKEELGPDAVILSSKEVHQGGRLMSYFNKPVLEVMAAAEYDPIPPVKPVRETPVSSELKTSSVASPVNTRTQPVGPDVFRETLQGMLAAPGPAPIKATEPVAPSSASAPRRMKPAPTRSSERKQDRLQELRKELRELSHELGASLPAASQSLSHHAIPAIATLCRNLVAQGLRPSSADRLGRSLAHDLSCIQSPESHDVQRALAKSLAQDLRVSGPLLSGQGRMGPAKRPPSRNSRRTINWKRKSPSLLCRWIPIGWPRWNSSECMPACWASRANQPSPRSKPRPMCAVMPMPT
jgi:flagellar biosynthesis protein FlhF